MADICALLPWQKPLLYNPPMVLAFVDDSREMLDFYQIILEMTGKFRVQIYEGAEDFLARYRGGADVIFVTEMMSVMGGKELKREILMRWDVPVIRKGSCFSQDEPGIMAEPTTPDCVLQKIRMAVA